MRLLFHLLAHRAVTGGGGADLGGAAAGWAALGRAALVLAAAALALGPAPLPAQAGTDPGQVTGRILDAGTGRPVAAASIELLVPGSPDRVDTGAPGLVITDATGRFRLPRVGPGTYLLQVSHVGYGTQGHSIQISPGERLELDVRISFTAISLDPVSVEVDPDSPSPDTRSSSRLIGRSEIEPHARIGRSLVELLQLRMPGASVRSGPGGIRCVEFRGGRMDRGQGACNSPRVIVDDVPVSEPSLYLTTASLSELQSIEFIPAGEATARYGDDAGLGVLLVRTHRGGFGPRPPSAAGVAPQGSFFATYDWASEDRSYPWMRSYLAATVGTLAGVAASMALQDCLHVDGAIQSSCSGSDTWTALGTAFALPLVGSTLAAQLAGTTSGSTGRILPKTLFAPFPFVVGAALLWEGDATDSEIPFWIGATLVTVGVPAITTVADGLFRRRRGRSEPPSPWDPQPMPPDHP